MSGKILKHILLFAILMSNLSCSSQDRKVSFKVQDTETDSLELNNLEKRNTFYTDTIKVDENNVPLSSRELYFPISFFPEIDIEVVRESDNNIRWIFHQTNRKDWFVARWYSGSLFLFREPILFNKKSDKEVYRFTWLRSFDEPIVVRIEKDNEHYSLTYKIRKISEQPEVKYVIEWDTIEVDAKDWDRLEEMLNSFDYWNSTDYGRPTLGTDGSEWILEGSKPTQYQVLTKWTPSSGAYREACLFLLSLTDDFKDVRVY